LGANYITFAAQIPSLSSVPLDFAPIHRFFYVRGQRALNYSALSCTRTYLMQPEILVSHILCRLTVVGLNVMVLHCI